jgi:hypothetical protein
MGAVLTKQTDCVSVRIDGKLSYVVWQTLRDARNLALAENLPLRIDVKNCRHADMGGIGAVMIAQEKLAKIELSGCSTLFAECFRAFGICENCTHNDTDTPCLGRIPVAGTETPFA